MTRIYKIISLLLCFLNVVSPEGICSAVQRKADVNRSGHVSALDSLWIINAINGWGGPCCFAMPMGKCTDLERYTPYDVNDDGCVTAADGDFVLSVIDQTEGGCSYPTPSPTKQPTRAPTSAPTPPTLAPTSAPTPPTLAPTVAPTVPMTSTESVTSTSATTSAASASVAATTSFSNSVSPSSLTPSSSSSSTIPTEPIGGSATGAPLDTNTLIGIIGASVGACAIISVTLLVVVCLFRRKSRRSNADEPGVHLSPRANYPSSRSSRQSRHRFAPAPPMPQPNSRRSTHSRHASRHGSQQKLGRMAPTYPSMPPLELNDIRTTSIAQQPRSFGSRSNSRSKMMRGLIGPQPYANMPKAAGEHRPASAQYHIPQRIDPYHNPPAPTMSENSYGTASSFYYTPRVGGDGEDVNEAARATGEYSTLGVRTEYTSLQTKYTPLQMPAHNQYADGDLAR